MKERSEAQKAADKRYRDKRRASAMVVNWSTELKTGEAAELNALIKARGMNKVQFLRWAKAKLETEG